MQVLLCKYPVGMGLDDIFPQLFFTCVVNAVPGCSSASAFVLPSMYALASPVDMFLYVDLRSVLCFCCVGEQ